MTAYQCILALKFLGIMGFGGGAVGAFLATDDAGRRRAVHGVASPCLLAVWVCGYTLVMLNGWPLFELWLLASVLLSVVAYGVLAYVAARNRTGLSAFLAAILPVVAIVLLMVLKPTWAG